MTGSDAVRGARDPGGFPSLAHLHDTLTLPAPAPTREGLGAQIFDLQQQLNRTRQDAAMADALGLPITRLRREIVWGEQCLDALLEAWSAAGAA
ncbi:MAG TPA: hypothetical protein VHC23_05215 [Jatrophihabitans sp.]|jgi:hypothetical protein|nr:hypothetical protein [Jatrophihabitans sp.]